MLAAPRVPRPLRSGARRLTTSLAALGRARVRRRGDGRSRTGTTRSQRVSARGGADGGRPQRAATGPRSSATRTGRSRVSARGGGADRPGSQGGACASTARAPFRVMAKSLLPAVRRPGTLVWRCRCRGGLREPHPPRVRRRVRRGPPSNLGGRRDGGPAVRVPARWPGRVKTRRAGVERSCGSGRRGVWPDPPRSRAGRSRGGRHPPPEGLGGCRPGPGASAAGPGLSTPSVRVGTTSTGRWRKTGRTTG